MAILSTRHQDIIIKGNHVVIGNPSKQSFSSFIEEIAKEVEMKPKAVQKRFFKILRNTHLLVTPLLVTTQKAHAEQMNIPIIDKAYSLEILPDEIVTILLQLIIAGGILGAIFATLCLMVAGGHLMIGNKDKSRGMTTDTIKGLGQILLAPVIIIILWTLTSSLFRNVPSLEVFF